MRPAQEVSAYTYIVKPGDTLTSISQAQRGTYDHSLLYEQNKETIGADKNHLYAGMKLIIPATDYES